jgi:hypothetical protein
VARALVSRFALLALVVLPAPACMTARAQTAPTVVVDRLLFGRSVPGGGEVTDSAWSAFEQEVVTPAFPAGFSVFHGRGQWRDVNGVVAREGLVTLEVAHPPDARVDSLLAVIASTYRRRFGQEAVLHLRHTARMTVF